MADVLHFPGTLAEALAKLGEGIQKMDANDVDDIVATVRMTDGTTLTFAVHDDAVAIAGLLEAAKFTVLSGYLDDEGDE